MFRKRGMIQISNVTVLILVGLLSGFNDIKAEAASTVDISTVDSTKTSDLKSSTVPRLSTIPNTTTVTTTITNRTSTKTTTFSSSIITSKTTTTTKLSTSSTTTTPPPTMESTTTQFPSTSGSTETSRSIVTTSEMSVIYGSNTSASHFTTLSNSSDISTPMFSGSTDTMLTTSNPGKSPEFTPGMILGVVLVVAMLIVIGGFILVHLKHRRKKSYKPFTKKSCLDCFKFTRLRSSSTTSHSPLTQDDSTSVDIPAANQDRELFSVGDQDGGNDGRPSSFGRPDGDDDYFYDEIFEQSAFQDHTTRQSNKHLTLSHDDDFDNFDDDELQLPDLTFRKPTSRI